MSGARRVTVIAHELRGFRPVGGMGTATTFLALALSRLGHSVEILLGKHDARAIDPHWAQVYGSAGIALRQVPEGERVEPWEFAHSHRVLLGLRDDPPDVVVAHDFGAPAYSALRVRQAGLGFENTLFVVFCHGPRRYVLDFSPELSVGDLRSVLGVSLLEQAAVELADVVVSPSAFLLEWMRAQRWALPERAVVIPYLTHAGAIGEPVPNDRSSGERLERLAFFGRIDEKKGVKVFAAALARLDPRLLDGIEIELVGRTSKTWPRERVTALLPRAARVVVAGELDQQEALDRLSRSGTLVVMPSLQDNSPNTVYECLERNIPFIASNVGGVRELVAPDDRARVLFEPTVEHLAAALGAVLADGHVPAHAQPAVDAETSRERWREVIELRPAPRRDADNGDADYVVVPGADDAVRDALVRAQRATGADVVTCGLRLGDGRVHLFAGDAGALGALRNAYGSIALVRRDLLQDAPHAWPEERDAVWPLLARLAASGASILSIPLPLAEAESQPGTVEDDPAAALRAVQELERALPDPLRSSARIASGLEAALSRDGRPDA